MQRPTLISIFQCTQDFQMRFYEACGFVHHNDMKADKASLHDEHHLLPLSLRESVEQDGDCSFLLNRGFVHHNDLKADKASLHDGYHLLPLSLCESVEQDGDYSFILNRNYQKTRGYTIPALY
jgi:hypothetical protein